jgi:hypothetical protein
MLCRIQLVNEMHFTLGDSLTIHIEVNTISFNPTFYALLL